MTISPHPRCATGKALFPWKPSAKCVFGGNFPESVYIVCEPFLGCFKPRFGQIDVQPGKKGGVLSDEASKFMVNTSVEGPLWEDQE